MSTVQEEILNLFSTLDVEEQNDVLAKLNNASKSSVDVDYFRKEVQKKYKKPVRFQVSAYSDPRTSTTVIEVVCHTPYGQFTAKGKNQKVAKAKAVSLAWEKI